MKRATLWVGREESDGDGEDSVAFYTSQPTLSKEKCGECGKPGVAFTTKSWIDGSAVCYTGWLKATKIALNNLEAVKISIGVEP